MKNATLWSILAILLTSSVIFLTWFRDGFVIYFWDATFPIDPELAIEKYSAVWHDFMGFGLKDINGIKFIPYFYILFFFHNLLGLSLATSQSILYYSLLASSGVGMFYFMKYILPNRQPYISNFASVGAALLYMFNMYAMLFLWRIFSNNLFLYATLPFIGILCIQIINSQKFGFHKFLMLFILFVIGSSAHPSILVILFILIVIGCSVKILLNLKKQVTKYLVRVSLLLATMLVANLFWLYPFSMLAQTTTDISNPYGGTNSALEFNSKYANPGQILQLKGQQILYEKNLTEYADWIPRYDQTENTAINNLSLLIPIVGSLCLFWVTRSSKILLSYISMLVLVFFVKGSHDPFGGFYLFLFDNIPGFATFRDPYSKFGFFYTFFVAIIFSAGLAVIMSTLLAASNRFKLVGMKFASFGIVFAIILLVAGVHIWPIWLGYHIPEATHIRPSARISIPPEYYDLSQFIKSYRGAIKILELPFQDRPLQSINLKSGYIGFPILRFMTFSPIICCIDGTQPQDNLTKYIADMIESRPNSPVVDDQKKANFLSALGIQYIVLHENANTDFSKGIKLPSEIKEILSSNKQLEFYKQFGEASVWKISKKAQPVIFGLNATSAGTGDRLSIANIVEDNLISPFEFKKLSSTKYEINMNKTSDGYRTLIFTQIYDPFWVASTNGTRLEHKRVYEFFNGYDLTSVKNASKITLEYTPQTLYELGATFTILGFFVLSVSAIFSNLIDRLGLKPKRLKANNRYYS